MLRQATVSQWKLSEFLNNNNGGAMNATSRDDYNSQQVSLEKFDVLQRQKAPKTGQNSYQNIKVVGMH